MNIEIYKALIELVRQGGTLALGGIGIWMTIGLIKTVVVSWVVYLAIKQVSVSVVAYHKDILTNKVLRVTLLSEEVSKTLMDTLHSYSQETQDILKDIETRLKDLQKESAKI
jgi:hypothetical protein